MEESDRNFDKVVAEAITFVAGCYTYRGKAYLMYALGFGRQKFTSSNGEDAKTSDTPTFSKSFLENVKDVGAERISP